LVRLSINRQSLEDERYNNPRKDQQGMQRPNVAKRRAQ